jgi:acyl transferase domain-containing protein
MTATVNLPVELDVSSVVASAKAAIAAELRRLADELDPPAPPAPPAPPVALIDGDGDRWERRDNGLYQYDAFVRSEVDIERVWGIQARIGGNA